MKFDVHKLVTLKRPNYATGQALTADDLRAEQEFQLESRWQHNRMLHGYGIVVGLEVGLQENDNGAAQAIVSPGYALDGWGRELVVAEPLSVYLPRDRHDLTVYLKFVEHDDDAKTIAPDQNAARIVASAQLTFEPSSSERALAPTQRADYAIPLARLRRPHQNWQRDRNFRPARAR